MRSSALRRLNDDTDWTDSCVALILTANENSGKIKWKQKTLIRPSGDVFSKRGVDQVLDLKKSITDTVFKAERFLVVQIMHK